MFIYQKIVLKWKTKHLNTFSVMQQRKMVYVLVITFPYTSLKRAEMTILSFFFVIYSELDGKLIKTKYIGSKLFFSSRKKYFRLLSSTALFHKTRNKKSKIHSDHDGLIFICKCQAEVTYKLKQRANRIMLGTRVFSF